MEYNAWWAQSGVTNVYKAPKYIWNHQIIYCCQSEIKQKLVNLLRLYLYIISLSKREYPGINLKIRRDTIHNFSYLFFAISILTVLHNANKLCKWINGFFHGNEETFIKMYWCQFKEFQKIPIYKWMSNMYKTRWSINPVKNCLF